MLSYLRENLDRLERYAVVKNAMKEKSEAALAESSKEGKETPGSMKQRALNSFLGKSILSKPQAPVQPSPSRIVMSRHVTASIDDRGTPHANVSIRAKKSPKL